MILSLEKFKHVVDEHAEQDITLYEVGQRYGDPRDEIFKDTWSALVWAPNNVDERALERALMKEDNGDYLYSMSPFSTGVHVFGKTFEDHSIEQVWNRWACEHADEWRVFCSKQ